ncbi:hypothetical protein N0O92_05855 [Alkalihalobacillus sp. MEB130]|uniref:hypothetical protein n=1 Tax=Alkalihalobacillus sp. MEB130 TaxID=2976704 RepID=UPI0028DF2EB3|nr:hypothetical protein [Alkalihalobacillus sp. MEB130]MDT8859751.1 hypothetical protein [Alkalihalobacillus sp. MEB130]
MSIKQGFDYQIADNIKGNFNSAEMLTVIRLIGNCVQFTLKDGKGYGSMPIEHMELLLKKNDLRAVANKRTLVKDNDEEAQIS